MAKKETYFLRNASERVTFEISGKGGDQTIKVVSVEENAKPQSQDTQVASQLGLPAQLLLAWLRQTKRGEQTRRDVRAALLKELRDK